MIIPLQSKRFWQDFDWVLLVAAVGLSLISVIEIYSATMAQGAETYFVRQLAWVGVGIVFLFIVAAIDYHLIWENIRGLFVLPLGALFYTLLLGPRVPTP